MNELDINGYKLEICSNSFYSAKQAQLGGASRVELCQNLENGGTTPSYAQIKLVRNALSIGVHVLIRPRSGDFLYNEEEFLEMQEDVKLCKEIGCDGVVIGILTQDGEVDIDRMKVLIELAQPMTVVFHRAFDKCKDPFKSLEDVISIGCNRILTSGQANTAFQGKALLKELILRANNRIEIMPGSGVDSSNVVDILEFTGAKSIHSSAKIVIDSNMKVLENEVQGMDEPVMYSSKEKVQEIVDKIKSL